MNHSSMLSTPNRPLALAAQGEQAMVTLGELLGLAIKTIQSSQNTGLVIYLQGDLGMGKTTLVRGIMQALGHEGKVKSPTYTLVEPYIVDSYRVNHFDLYRLGHPEELEFIGIRDYVTQGQINLVEWPERGHNMLPKADLIIQITGNSEQRQLHNQAYSAMGGQIIGKWEQLTTSKQRPL